jgi:uncharacterized membrane protein
MFSKSNLLGTLVGTVSFFVLTILFYILLFATFLDNYHHEIEGLHKDNPSNFWFYLSLILMSFILSTIYGKFKKENHNFIGGFEIGAWVAAFFFLGTSILHNSTLNHLDMIGVILSGVVAVIMVGIVAGLIALVYKVTSK